MVGPVLLGLGHFKIKATNQFCDVQMSHHKGMENGSLCYKTTSVLVRYNRAHQIKGNQFLCKSGCRWACLIRLELNQGEIMKLFG